MKAPDFSEFDQHALEYDTWYDKNAGIYQSEVLAIRQAIPENKTGIEVGVGTGRFARTFGIKIGIEPSEYMANVAEQRGIKVVRALAENIPLAEHSYDFALMVTTDCFLTDISKAFSEVNRILKPGGEFVLGMIDKNSSLGKKYELKKSGNKFYKKAHFHSPKEITELLKQAGFIDFHYWQTLINPDKNEIEKPSTSYGKGGFVVIKADKVNFYTRNL